MSFHTVAFTVGSLTTSYGAVPGVADTIFAPSGNGLLLPYDLWLIAAYASHVNLLRARVNAPSLLRVGYPSIRPVQAAALGAPQVDPNLMTMLDSPLLLRSSEAVGIDAAASSGATAAIALMWLADKLDPVPPGESFWLRFTSTTAPTTAFAWTVISPVYDQAIPSGVYAVIGMEFFSTTAIAARIVFPGSVLRPGVLAQQGSSAGLARTHRIFYEGALGVYGTFQTNSPPNVEVITGLGTDAAGSVDGYLRVVRIGDIGTSPPAPMGSAPSLGTYGAGAGSSSTTHRAGPPTISAYGSGKP